MTRFEYDIPKKRRGAAVASRFRIESETLTVAEIATRLGISDSATRSRMKALRGASGAITWARLGLLNRSEAA